MALRILSYGVHFLVPTTIVCIAVLIPLYHTAGDTLPPGVDSTSYAFIRMTIANVPDGSPLMW